MNKKKILVTGGAGFVGSALVRLLIQNGFKVIVFDNLCRGMRANLAGLPVELVVGDICNQRAITQCVNTVRPEIIYHLAAMHFIPDCNRYRSACLKNNVVGTENVLVAAERSAVKRIIMPSSMAVYPITDSALSENHPVGPYDIYGETKAINEMQLKRWATSTGNNSIAVRLANVYGPRETNAHVIPVIMDQIKEGITALSLGNIDTFRDYIYTDDVARALVMLGDLEEKENFHVYNLGTGREYSVRQIIEILEELLGVKFVVKTAKAKIRAFERMHLLPDVSRIQKAIAWKPQVNMRDGLRNLCVEYGLRPSC